MGGVALIARGIYDGVEVARLIRRDPSAVAGWTTSRRNSPAIVEPDLADLFSFVSLVSLHVVSELRRRGVKRKDIYQGGRYLAQRLGTSHPFAHEGLATVGHGFFAEVGPWLDVGSGGQQAFQGVIEPLLRPIRFERGLASSWRPADGVLLDPRVQAGSPCIEGTRVPTAVVRALVERQGLERVLDDLRLTREEAGAAVAYETYLDQRAA